MNSKPIPHHNINNNSDTIISKNKTQDPKLNPSAESSSDEYFSDCDTYETSSTVSSEAMRRKRRSFVQYLKDKSGSFASGVGRIPGSILNQVVRAGMNTPIVKYLLKPQTLKKALNNDPVLRETYSIILNSEPVRKLLTPEALRIILDSETAKEVLTPQLVLDFWNHDIIASFMTPENIKFIMESQVVRDICSKEAVLNNMESKSAKMFLRKEVVHEIAYSELFTQLMDPEFHEKFLRNEGVERVMTKEAIQHALQCQGSKITMNQEFIDRLMGVEGVMNLIRNRIFNEQCLRWFRKIEKEQVDEVVDCDY